MANQHHIEMLKKGVAEWNRWRQRFPTAVPDLSNLDVYLINVDLAGGNFREANFARSRLRGVNFTQASLYDATLAEAQLIDAKVFGADLRGADFSHATVDGIRYDKQMKCLGARVETCTGSPRFKRTVLEADYIESFCFEHPLHGLAWRLSSDYSRSPFRASAIACLIIACFAVVYAICPALIESSTPRNWFSPLYYSIVTFSTLGYGDIHPSGPAGQILASLEVMIGYLWLGYLVAILANRASPRA
jgi:Ion channel/Pentapeptide repeats (8 copies)